MSHDRIVEVNKFNPYHDEKGRFATANAATSFTYSPGKSKAHDNAIAREKERQAERDKQAKSALVKPDKPVHTHARYYSWSASWDRTVLEATENAPGELTLSRPTPTHTRTTSRYSSYQYDLEHGIDGDESVGIDWDKVQTVKGKTWDAKHFLKDKGFHYDPEKKIYTREQPKVSVSDGKLTIPRGGKLPSDLSGVNRISGDTYANKDKIKAAGFKWDSKNKEWVRPGVAKSAESLLDDCPYDHIIEAGET